MGTTDCSLDYVYYCIEAVVASSHGSLEETGTPGFPPFLPSSLPMNLGVWPPEGVYS